ncbi:mitochondrial import inner membrane translocase subunit TIM22-4-like [Malus sylvestris]|uniref:mitochondrial import inner membrane translocase subunit TIM22-4-like n=1 Tax=Malus sylvestris TaxID=3752 RepID=UPI0021ACB0F6|nr:mitochondrial import inner membrane translocase subunit TIM22-4-like [Malus sylvestris]
MRGQDIWNNCAVRSVVSGVMGGGLGLMVGLLLGALDTPIMQDEMTGKQEFIYQAKSMGRRSWSSAKAFAVMGLLFSAAECVVEQARAKHDTTNSCCWMCNWRCTVSQRLDSYTSLCRPVVAGPQAACIGCAGFAAFSVLIEKFLDRHD